LTAVSLTVPLKPHCGLLAIESVTWVELPLVNNIVVGIRIATTAAWRRDEGFGTGRDVRKTDDWCRETGFAEPDVRWETVWTPPV